MGPPTYPPPTSYPYGYPPPNTPVNTGYPPPASPPQPPIYPPYYPIGYPTPRRSSSGTALIIVGSILLGISVLGALGRVADTAALTSRSARSAHVGQCTKESTLRDNVLNPAPEDCADPDALLEVVTEGDGSAKCPDGKLQSSRYAFLHDDTTTLCLMLNLAPGHCYSVAGAPDNPTFALTDCNGSLPGFKVSKRIDGSANTELCDAGTRAIAYPDPASRLYCLQPLNN